MVCHYRSVFFMERKAIDNSNRRVRRVSFERSYIFDISDKDKNVVKNQSEEEWKKEVEETLKNTGYDEIWLIYHDKDTMKKHDEKTDTDKIVKKELHCHGIVINKNNRILDAIKIGLGIKEDPYNYFCDQINSDSGAFRYLTHTTNEAMKAKKYRYDINELKLFKNGKEITDKNEIRELYTLRISKNEKGRTDKTKDGIAELIQSLLVKVVNGELTELEARETLTEQYGASGLAAYLKNSRIFDRAGEERMKDRIKKMKMTGRNLTTAYVYGVSNVAKTAWIHRFCEYVMAREHLGDDYNAAVYNAPDTGNFKKYGTSYYMLSGYKNQPITVIDDVESSVFEFSAFNKIFEKHEIPLVRNRNSDKYWFSEKAFIARAEKPEVYFSKIYNDEINRLRVKTEEEKENILRQVYKRIRFEIELTDTEIILYRNIDSINFKEVARYELNIGDRVNAEKSEEVNKKIYDLLYEAERADWDK